MNDMKEFLKLECVPDYMRLKWGLFFWERGGKKFVHTFVMENGIFHEKRQKLNYLVPLAEKCISKTSGDFLDCVACLREKVEELISELQEGRELNE